MKKLSIALFCLAAVCGCRRTDVRDFTISIPAMTPADRSVVTGALARYGGVDKSSYVFDDAKRTLTLKYDSMQVAKKNLEISIAKAGFTANGVTPESVGAKSRK